MEDNKDLGKVDSSDLDSIVSNDISEDDVNSCDEMPQARPEGLEFDVKMKSSHMYKFMMYHSYTTFSGLFGLCISLAALIILIVTFEDQTEIGIAVLLLATLLWTVINPIMLWTRSKRQVAVNKVYKEALTYIINDDGITVAQGEANQLLPWANVYKVRATKSMLLVYSSKIHAFVFPYECMKENKKAIEAQIVANLKKEGKKIPKRLREIE